MIRLDDFILLREKRPGLIKIDVEGSEAEVLEGCSGLVNSEIIVSFEGDRRKSAMRAVQKALVLRMFTLVGLVGAVNLYQLCFSPQTRG